MCVDTNFSDDGYGSESCYDMLDDGRSDIDTG